MDLNVKIHELEAQTKAVLVQTPQRGNKAKDKDGKTPLTDQPLGTGVAAAENAPE